MITRRYREPRGLHAETKDYGFFVRLSGDDRDLLKRTQALAERELGGKPSNPMLLVELMRVYTGEKHDRRTALASAYDDDQDI